MPRGRLPFHDALRTWFALFVLGFAASAPAGPRIDQIQVVGTHNSYHVAPHPSLDALIRSRNAEVADSLAYTHRSLTEQLERLGIRQIELDVYADPQGGRYAEPAGIRVAASRNLPAPPAPDVAVLRTPGGKILHSPDFDYLTTVPSLRVALQELEAWSVRYPSHLPVFVMLELKGDAAGAEFTQPLAWTSALLEELEREILDVLPAHRLFRPDDLRGNSKSLREAVAGRGWPEIGAMRGRFVFLLDNTDGVRGLLLAPSVTLAGRVLFASVEEDHPAAAWFKINDALAEGDRIRRLVRAGFLVRTRADIPTVDARLGDTRRREAAFASGAQLISTDYPEANPSFGAFRVRLPGGVVARPNPVSMPDAPAGADLEEIAPRGFDPFAAAELDHLNYRAMRAHVRRSLTEASTDYARLLELDPARPVSPDQARVIAELCPILLTVAGEPFPLRDIVALHHPSKPLIGYHLFWADDIDFPDDNDPTDHEIVWVSYNPVDGRANRIFTYFHGEILTIAAPSGVDRPWIAVEWGKHGSLPLENGQLAVEPQELRRNWQRLRDSGIRMPNHPLAHDWPNRFGRDYTAYRRFDEGMDPRPLLEQPQRAWLSSRANAVLDYHALPYNFAPKIEWPE